MVGNPDIATQRPNSAHCSREPVLGINDFAWRAPCLLSGTMKSTRLAFLILWALRMWARAPADLTGVWRANLAKSAVPAPAPTDYLVLVTQKGAAITVKTLVVRTPANTRNEATYDPSVPQTANWIRGNPTKSHASWAGSTLRVESSYTFGGALQTYEDEWTLGPGGTPLQTHTQAPAPESKMVFEKQPAGAAAEFDKPEKTAREAYRNVQTLNVPASSVLPIMNTYCL